MGGWAAIKSGIRLASRLSTKRGDGVVNRRAPLTTTHTSRHNNQSSSHSHSLVTSRQSTTGTGTGTRRQYVLPPMSAQVRNRALSSTSDISSDPSAAFDGVNSSKIQRLYDACADAFQSNYRGSRGSGEAAVAPEKLKIVNDVLASITTLEDINLSMAKLQEALMRAHQEIEYNLRYQRYPSNELSAPHPVLYCGIVENEAFTIGVFCIPAGGMIPLHDHPSMTVSSKLVKGKLHIKAYDFIKEEGMQAEERSSMLSVPPNFKRAKMSVDTIVDSENANTNFLNGVCMNPATLFPTHGGNIHEFRAISHCVVLDVLSPPYAPAQGRDCTYYQVHEKVVKPQEISPTTAPSSVFVDVVIEDEKKEEEGKKEKGTAEQNVQLYLSACPEPTSFMCTNFHGYVAPDVNF